MVLTFGLLLITTTGGLELRYSLLETIDQTNHRIARKDCDSRDSVDAGVWYSIFDFRRNI